MLKNILKGIDDMKKLLFILFITIIGVIPVRAANYDLRELIPVNVETTIVTDNFSYKDFYYNDNELEADTLNNNFIIFKSIENLTTEERPVSISIGLFDSDKKNIGVINYCSSKDETSVMAGTILKSKEEKSYVIEVSKKNLADQKTVKDIKYISVLSDNINCNTRGSLDQVGRTVEEIAVAKNKTLDSQSELLITVMSVIGIALVALFLYKFLFTTAYQNVDGSEVRNGYRKYNQELAKERERELRRNPPKEKEPVKVKSDEVLQQEEAARNEDKSGTDLHNLYK